MWMFVASCLASLVCVHANPGRPPIPDDPKARLIFQTAEAHRTPDGVLTLQEMADIFTKFDMDDDGNIDETEFVAHWTALNLGDLEHAITLFDRADTNNDGQISRVPDYPRVFYYFDRNNDHQITETEFVTGWYDLSS